MVFAVPGKKAESKKVTGNKETKPLHEISTLLPAREDAKIPPNPAEFTGLASEQTEFEKMLGPSKPSAFRLATDNFTEAMHSLSGVSSGDICIMKSFRYSAGREQMLPGYIAKLQNLIITGNQYIKELHNVETRTKVVLGEENFHLMNSFINKFIAILARSTMDPFACNAIAPLQQYQELLSRVFKAKGKIGGFDEECKRLTLTLTENLFGTFITLAGNRLFQELADFLVAANDMYESIQVQNAKASSLQAALHNIENTIIEARIIIFTHPNLESIKRYLEINRSLLTLQVVFLEVFNKTPDPVIALWPVFNRDLLRTQEKEKPLNGNLLLTQKRRDLEVFDPAQAAEFTPCIDPLNQSDKINSLCKRSQGNIDEFLTTMTQLCQTEAANQNALVRTIVFAATINCHLAKNNSHIAGNNKSELQKDIPTQIAYLRHFINNLSALKLAWNGKTFQFIHNFIFIKHYIYEATSATEFAFLACEMIFNRAAKNDLQLKNQVIEMQIELLDMQNKLLAFIRDVCGEDYVKHLYFMNKSRNVILCYDTIDRNQELAAKKEMHKIVQGLPIAEVLARNAMIKLRLEAIPLEFLAEQRSPQDSDYQHAISGDELEKQLQQWEQEDAQQKELKSAFEEKQHKAQLKQKQKNQNRKKIPEKGGEKGQKERAVVVAAKLKSKSDEDPLAITLNKLLQGLNPRQFDAEAVREVIGELFPMTLTSSNYELVFNALSASGDSYIMIATHHLTHAKTNPKILLVNLKLALNFYSRAELVLGKLADIPVEKRDNYYTWLRHSVGKQQHLLERSIQKLTRKFERLALSKERAKAKLGDKWYRNHLKPGWTKSERTLEAEELQNAFAAVRSITDNCTQLETEQQSSTASQNIGQNENRSIQALQTLQEKCAELGSRLQVKIKELVNNQQAYAFEYYLNHAGKRPLPKPQEELPFDEEAEEEVLITESSTGGVFNIVSTAQSQVSSLTPPLVLYQSPSMLPLMPYNPFITLQWQTAQVAPYALAPIQQYSPAPSWLGAYYPPVVWDPYQPYFIPPQLLGIPPFANTSPHFPYTGTAVYFAQPPEQLQIQTWYAPPQLQLSEEKVNFAER
jgi:hypothetical protein